MIMVVVVNILVIIANPNLGKLCCHKSLVVFAFEMICLLLFYALAMSQVISKRVPTCESEHSWPLYSAAPPPWGIRPPGP